MRKEIKQIGNKAISVKAIAGTYVVLLSMNVNEDARKGLLGFAIHRTNKTNNTEFWLKNSEGFEAVDPNPQPGVLTSTEKAPIQKFVWGDYTTKPNTDYIFKIVPVYGSPNNLTYGAEVNIDIKTENEDNQEHAIYFNRGVAGSQAYARKFGNKSPIEVGDEAFKWLSRGLEEAILAFIGQANDPSFSIRAAAYEFSHEKTLNAFGNASKTGADVKIVYDARKLELKQVSDAAIEKAGIQELMIPRTSDTSFISHNKYIILLKNGKPIQVLTGSTNFTDGGIYGQSNVVHIVRNETVAEKYLEYWQLLADDTPVKKLRPLNIAHTPTPVGIIPQGIHPIFSPRTSVDVLEKYSDEIDKAESFSGFTAAFGVNLSFRKVMAKNIENIRYVLLEKSNKSDEDFKNTKNNFVAVGDVLDKNSNFQAWLSEQTTDLNEHVKYLHTKYLLLDPLSDNPTVISGSANFSEASTTKNDENMLIIKGNTMVADIYFGEFMRLWYHFHFRNEANKLAETNKKSRKKASDDSSASAFLKDNDSWTNDYFGGNFQDTKEKELFNQATIIGGDICTEVLPSGLILSENQILSFAQKEFLWQVFVEIGNTWKNVNYNSANLKSSWLEMIQAKTTVAPSYVGEYINAVYAIQELINMYGEKDAFHKLFLVYKLPTGPPTTRLAHAKVYVVNEFITMQVMASGFKHFGGKNYHGYVKGSRYNLEPLVRENTPTS